MGGGSGVSLGLGSVAGVLGVGGTIGQLAGGISVGGGSSHSVSKTYSQQRIIAIPPHGNKNLTEEKWVKSKNKYLHIENAESFEFRYDRAKEMNLKRGMVNRGDVITFNENESPWKREFIITYSTDESFRSFSSIKAELFIHEIIGCKFFEQNYSADRHKFIEGFDEYTIVGSCSTDKD